MEDISNVGTEVLVEDANSFTRDSHRILSDYLDDKFCEGYSKDNSEAVAKLVMASAINLNTLIDTSCKQITAENTIEQFNKFLENYENYSDGMHLIAQSIDKLSNEIGGQND